MLYRVVGEISHLALDAEQQKALYINYQLDALIIVIHKIYIIFYE